MKMTNLEKQIILKRATAKLYARDAAPVNFELELVLVVGLIGQLQLAFRHLRNTGASRLMVEKFVLELIGKLDPEQGDVYKFLMMGFDEAHDE